MTIFLCEMNVDVSISPFTTNLHHTRVKILLYQSRLLDIKTDTQICMETINTDQRETNSLWLISYLCLVQQHQTDTCKYIIFKEGQVRGAVSLCLVNTGQ